MSERHSFGGYNLEVHGHDLIVRDDRGAVVETVDLEKIDGEFQLPNGQQVDLASLLLDKEVDPADFETAAGGAEGAGGPESGPIAFRTFGNNQNGFVRETAAGTLGDTSISYRVPESGQEPDYQHAFSKTPTFDEPTIPVVWASHDQWSIPENQEGGDFGRLINGDPADFTFVVSDDRFDVVDGVLQLKDGFSFDFESESFIDIQVTATSKTGDSKTQSVRIDVIDENEGQTGIDLDNALVAENVAGAAIGKLTVSDPDAGDSQSFKLSDNRFEVVNGELKLKNGVALDFETEPSVNVTVTATDKGGHSISQQFTIVVGDVNEAQTALSLKGAHVAENAAGAIIGDLTVADPDKGDSQTFAVSDGRFEVINGQLKLKDGVSLDFEAEPTVNVTVTATDKGGYSISEQFTLGVGDVNEAQTALTWTGASIAENSKGAVAGTLSVTDPDAGDSQSFKVSDNRFEVVNGELKLKNGHSLDFESEPTVNVTITATDKAGHQISQTVTVNVTDVNEAQTGMSLSGSKVAENAAGAAIGTLAVTDPDAGDSQSFKVSDSRFEVVDNQLKLKSGVALDFEQGASVNVTVTATDKGGHEYSKTFSISVSDVHEAAPVVTVKDGAINNHIVDVNLAYSPSANAEVGDYLYSNDNSNGKKPDASLLNGVAGSNMVLTAPTEVTVTFQKESAGNHNMVGTYQYDDAGNIIPGSVKFVWLDASATHEGKIGSGMVTDFLGFVQAGTVSLGTMEAGTHVGFFTISNGASFDANKTLLTDAAGGASTQAAAMATIASQLSIKVDADGNAHVFVGNTQMSGDTFFTHDKSLNTDFSAGGDIDHMASGVSSKLDHQLIIGVEDLNGGGDRDYNDVVFSVNLGSYNVENTTQSITQPSVDFSDIDSNSLSKAVIHTSGFQSGDSLDIPANGSFNVTVSHASNDYTITIVGKTGAETVDQYESFVNSIHFGTTSTADGTRQISYNIVDEGGLTSNIGTAKIGVSNGYEISSSEIHPSQHELGAGNDHFYLNSNLKGTIDFGDGYDTLHLARAGEGLSGSEMNRLDSVEAIDMTGYGTNKVALSINDVLDLTDSSHHLTILGDKGDTVTLSGDNSGHHWSMASTGNEFTTYVWSDPLHQAVVEISNQLTATLSA